ncbi:hypothetical protein EJB05_52701 [Eragrostis curvula]|uniref:Uncharacterized protein n=1 Tax=Eragrostis curvula TaxID=38414 RepID=A0A5J9SS96_9POAL|nr:hypothetical protein EJB05_52701 [Eragrostis curvula]
MVGFGLWFGFQPILRLSYTSIHRGSNQGCRGFALFLPFLAVYRRTSCTRETEEPSPRSCITADVSRRRLEAFDRAVRRRHRRSAISVGPPLSTRWSDPCAVAA